VDTGLPGALHRQGVSRVFRWRPAQTTEPVPSLRGGDLGKPSRGRFVWQLTDAADLVVAWRLTPSQDPKVFEASMLADFIAAFGRLPFANLKEGKKSE